MLATLFSHSASAVSIRNEKVSRHYKINNDLVVVDVEIAFKNEGDSPATEYRLSFDKRESLFMNTLVVSANRTASHNTGKSFKITENGSEKVVQLPKPVPAGESSTIHVGYTLGRYLLFTTEDITLKNMRLECFFNTTVAFVSPYKTTKSNLEVTGVTKNSITKMSSINGIKTRMYSISISTTEKPDDNEFFIEYYTFKALPYVTLINTTTMVSHWGITKQESYVEVHNNGPKFAGEFNRIDFKETSNCFIQNIPIRPPKESYNFWASDESGQLQKEIHLIQNDLDIPLRGPMLPSWKATFKTGWTVKTERFVSGKYTFTAPLFPRTFGDKGSSVASAHSEFIFPEGAIIKKVNVPDAVHAKVSQTTKICNLDINGRPAVEIEAEKLSSIDDITISIEYDLPDQFAINKIVYLSFAFTVIFLAIVIIRRIDLSIKHQKKE